MRFPDRRQVEQYCGPTTVYHVISEILPWVFFLVSVILLAAGWKQIPDQVPMQMDGRGNVTSWGSKGTLIVLIAVYAVVNLTLWIIGYFPRSWNSGFRIRFLGRKLNSSNTVQNYRLMRDFLSDMRISMSLLFAGELLLVSFGSAGPLMAAAPWLVLVLVAVPMLRYMVRLFLWR